MGGRIERMAAEIAVRVVFFRRLWREAMPEDRAVYYFLAGWAGILIAAGYWFGS